MADDTESEDVPARAGDDPVDAPDDDPKPARPRRSYLVVGGCTAVAFGLLIAVLVSRTPAPPAPAVAAPPPILPPATTAPTTTEPTTTTTDGVTTTTRKPRRTPTGPPGPLTNAPVDLPGDEKRPALVIKIDNLDPDARPQAGVNQADIVFEEKVEGPYSRFAAVFQGSDADTVGPVRSARSTDVEIVGQLHNPLFAYSGANGGFQALLSISPLIDVGAGARGGAFWRGGDKPMPHNLYTSTAALWAGVNGYTPTPLWPFRGANEPPGPGARPITSAAYHFGGWMTLVNWTWTPEEGGWVRTQNGSTDFDMDNWPITVQNVVIQYVPYEDSETADMFGNPVPEAVLGGSGNGFVLTGGAAIPMTWGRYQLDEPTSYLGPDGQPIKFAPGHTWVALVPVNLPAALQ